MPTWKPKQQAMNNSPGTRYSYTTEGNLVRIEAITSAGVAGVWHVPLAQALNFAIKQAKAEPAR